jgi:hypothetical protein
MSLIKKSSLLASGALLAFASGAGAQPIDSSTVAGMRWRTVGPANFMGRLSDVVGIPSPSKTVFIAAAGGGIWKSTNNGITWRPTFDDKRVISMGMLAIAPTDTQQVWAGTGEPNSRNSIDPGGGIYKSTDGGLTWTLKGLEKTEAIGRIAVHPTNPNTVFVAALGATWRSNPERGLYKTVDGGNSWTMSKFVSDKAGFVDVAINPQNPNIIFAASWERYRTPYSLKSGGPGSALWKSTDGGTSWTEVKGGGWPVGVKGRLGLSIAASNPNVIYVMMEGTGTDANGNYTPSRTPRDNGLWRSTDGGATWTKMNSFNVRPVYYSQVRADPKNPDRVYFSSTDIQVSDDGGKTHRNAAQGVHIDDHGLWIDPNDTERMVIANDGGVAFTFDRGGNFIQHQNLAIGQFYEVAFDYAVPYNICGGAQDNGTWCGPSKRRGNQTTLGYWYTIAGGDGFYAAMDPTDPSIVYGESQGGNASRVNLKTGERAAFQKPTFTATYRQWEDSIAVVRGDPTGPMTRAQTTRIAALRARQKADSATQSIRYNWNSPFFLSPHNPATVYFAGSKVLKSTKRGEDMRIISPDLSKGLTAKLDTSLRLTGGITLDATGAETYGTVVALEESPARAGLLYAGTDDGNVWKSSNDGATWENLASRIPGLPNAGEVYVTRIEASAFDTNTVYVAFDNHRWGDFKPYLFVSKDGGKSFQNITSNLPVGGPGDFLRVVREDPRNPDLLFVGSSIGVYASIDRGTTWNRFMANMPSVPIYDLQIHPRDRELIAATHGRSFWIVDIAPLEQLTAKTIAERAFLFEPKTAFGWGEMPTLGASGNGNAQGFFATVNPAYGAAISYRIAGGAGAATNDNTGGNGAMQDGSAQAGGAAGAAGAGGRGGRGAGGGQPRGAGARISIVDALGDTLQTLTGPSTPGLHTVTWAYNITRPVVRAPLSPSEKRDSILRAIRGPQVLDSLTAAKYDSAAIATARTLLAPAPAGGIAAFGGRGGGGGAAAGCERPFTMWDQFCARPAEPTPTPGGGGGRGGAGGANTEAVAKIFALIGVPIPGGGGGRGGGGGFGGAAGASATTGDYSVVLQVNGVTMKQKLRFENTAAGGASAFFGGEEDEEQRDRDRGKLR